MMGYQPENNFNFSFSFKSISKVLSLFVIGIGCIVLIGWALNIPELKSIFPNSTSMKSNSALFFVLSGTSLWLQLTEKTQRIAQALAFVISFLGLITLGEYLFNSDFGIDQLLFRDFTVGVLYPGRMSPATALAFFLIGLALVFLDKQTQNHLNELLVLIVFTICGLALIGYLYGISSLYQIGEYSSMAFHTAFNFVLLSVGILFARPEQRLMQTILADTPGGDVLRRFFPTAIVLPILLGWIILWGQRLTLYDTAFGLALMVISLITFLTIFIWFNAKRLTELDLNRQQINDHLQESEKRLRDTFETMMEGCQIIGHDWRYLYLNDAAEKHNRRPNHELIGNVYMDMWPGIESTAVFVALQRCMEERTSHHMITEFIYPDGVKGWFELNIQPIADGIFILSSDITSRKQAEYALLEREMKLTILLEILPVGISILDAESKITYANSALRKILDISEEDLFQGIYGNRKYIKADGSAMLADELASRMVLKEKREINGVETGVVKEDNNIVWTSVSAVPVDFADWKVVIVTSDITEHKRADENLRAAESRYRAIVEHLPAIIYLSDPNKLIGTFYIGPQIKTLGFSQEEWIADPELWVKQIHPEDREQVLAKIRDTETYNMLWDVEYRILTRDGKVRWFHDQALSIMNDKGEPIFIQGFMQDVTERKQAESEILKLNATLEGKVADRTAELATANEQLRQLSLFDPLTGLYNRRGFLLLAEEQLLLARRTKHNLLVFYADLDRLKQVNDQFGHTAGDEAIIMAVDALNKTFRSSDIKARLGGDEFIVLVVEADEYNIEMLLLTRLHENLAQNDQSMSVGVVSFDAQDESSIQDLIARADEAMYVEKRKKTQK